MSRLIVTLGELVLASGVLYWVYKYILYKILPKSASNYKEFKDASNKYDKAITKIKKGK